MLDRIEEVQMSLQPVEHRSWASMIQPINDSFYLSKRVFVDIIQLSH